MTAKIIRSTRPKGKTQGEKGIQGFNKLKD
jgi:hypothetical protein